MHSLMHCYTYGLTSFGNSHDTNDTSTSYSGSCKNVNTHKLSSTIKPSGPSLLKPETSSCTNIICTPSSKIYGWEEPSLSQPSVVAQLESPFNMANQNLQLPARNSTLVPVSNQSTSVPIAMSAWSAEAVDTLKATPTVRETKARVVRERRELRDLHPKYTRDFLWEEDRRPTFLTSADLSCDPVFATPPPDAPPWSSFWPVWDSEPFCQQPVG